MLESAAVNGVLLSIHVLAGIALIGPITVAASLFPRYARQCLQPGAAGLRAQGVVVALHRITSGYAVVALAVPVFGLATALAMHVLGQVWLLAAIVATLIAALLLGAAVVPTQRRLMATIGDVDPAVSAASASVTAAVQAGTRRLGMTTGWFALAWATVVVLMIVRPGSTTGVWQ